MNVIKEIERLKQQELSKGLSGEDSGSWHSKYRDSAYIFVGGLGFTLTEGDIICIFSQFGEILDIHLVRDSNTGASKGYCFIKYENQRSTILAVDNFNGAKILGRAIRVDHTNYNRPKAKEDDEEHNAAPPILPAVPLPTVNSSNKRQYSNTISHSDSEYELYDSEDPMKEMKKLEKEEKRQQKAERKLFAKKQRSKDKHLKQ